MFSRFKAFFQKPEPDPECFVGLGVVLISDLCNVHLLAERLTPIELVKLTNRTLEMQTKIIRRHGGIIDKYIGGCVVAYWPPKLMPGAVSAASLAAVELSHQSKLRRISFNVRVSFAAAEFMVAAFGPAGRQRFQAVGRAYERADTMLKRLREGGVMTDAETLGMLDADQRTSFEISDGYAIHRASDSFCLGKSSK